MTDKDKRIRPGKASTSRQKTKMEALGQDLAKKYGPGAARLGADHTNLAVIPTGILALDFALGTGGWPLGHAVGLYGKRDIGKSTNALMAVANAQRLNLPVAWIAAEPTFDPTWAQMFGVDVDDLLVMYPKTGEEAFQMLYRCVEAEAGLTVFDSIGAILGETEVGPDGKPRAGGQAGLVTWGVKNVAPLAYRNSSCVMYLNQIRDDMGAKYAGAVKQPGGHALEHVQAMHVHLKGGGVPYKIGSPPHDTEIGRPMIAHVTRNKLSQGSGKKALYDVYYMETDDYPFGIDQIQDVINTGKRTGVIKTAGAYYDLPDGAHLQGKKEVAAHLASNPKCFDLIRNGVLSCMHKAEATKLEVVGGD